MRVPDTGSEGSAVQFSSAGSHDPNGKPIGFAWNLGDGNTSTEANPSHTYANNGTYTVTLTVRDQSGLKHTATTSATIANVAPREPSVTSPSAMARRCP